MKIFYCLLFFASVFFVSYSVTPNKPQRHYYLIGYSGKGEGSSWSGQFYYFTNKLVESEVKQWIKENNEVDTNPTNIVVLGIYEFKDSTDMVNYSK